MDIHNLEDMSPGESESSFANLLKKKEDNTLRDAFVYFDGNTPSGALQVGYVIVYPGCRTNGHTHEDKEEIYYITRGKGTMVVGEEEYEVKSGDTFCVPPKTFHATINEGSEPVEAFWVVSDLERS